MALAVGFIDGLDHYNGTGVGEGGLQTQWNQTNSQEMQPSLQTGLRGRGHSIRFGQIANYATLMRPVPSCTKYSFHFALRVDKIIGDSFQPFMCTRNLYAQNHHRLSTTPGGHIQLGNAVTGQPLATSAKTIVQGIDYRMVLAIDADIGTADLWINGSHEDGFSATGLNLWGNANHTIDSVHWEMNGLTNWVYLVDDLVFCTGAAQNIGELEVLTQVPTGDFLKEFSRLSGPDNFAMVNSLPFDGDASYNYSSVVGNRDKFNWPGLPITPDSIFCMSMLTLARKEEAGTRAISHLTGQAGGDFEAAVRNLSTGYDHQYTHWLLNPETAAKWQASELAAAHFGYRDAL